MKIITKTAMIGCFYQIFAVFIYPPLETQKSYQSATNYLSTPKIHQIFTKICNPRKTPKNHVFTTKHHINHTFFDACHAFSSREYTPLLRKIFTPISAHNLLIICNFTFQFSPFTFQFSPFPHGCAIGSSRSKDFVVLCIFIVDSIVIKIFNLHFAILKISCNFVRINN